MKNDYNIGLDIGNTSVGWAVTDCNNFKILKKGKKTLWGVRLFEAANTAEERRKYRSNRRKYDRRRQRIKLLQEEFKEEINKVDSTFFKKLEESFYNETDVKNKTIIINKEEKEKIKEYYKKYPTIYHLRSRLIHDKSQCDIRLVYLALHHIIKYRGNFLYNNSFNIENLDIEAKLDELIINLKNITNIDIVEENFNSIEIKEALSTISKVDKKINLNKCLPKIFSKKISQELIKLFLGDKFDVYKLFGIESDNDYKISLNGTDYEEKYDEINKILGDEIEILECLKNIYDMCFLINLFGNNKTENISDLMINIYNKHHEDLKTLKNIYKKDKKLYIKMFKENNCIYEQYLSNNLTYDNFIKQITKDLESINQNNFNDLENIKNRITNGEFLPLITSKNNGKYPYQLNKNELIKIIENQGVYYNFLLNKLDNNVYKLVKLLEFKIPYYVGPLNNTTKNSNIKNPNSWFIKKIENVKVTPYNFDEIIDKEKTAEKFIERMIGKCTYLINEPSMPANSILYSKYKVLNELKQIRVGEKGHEEKLRKELQDKIYKELFLTTNSITDKKFKDYLISTNEFSMIEDLSVLGYSDNNKFANNMSSYIDFFGPNGYLINTKYNINDAENIIRLMTIFEDKNILKEKLEKEYPLINQKNIENICRKKYKGWGNLSKKLLTEVYYFDKKEEKSKSILTLMEETSENFMQILNNKEYNYDQKIKEINNKKGTKEKFNYDIVSDLVTSPSTKRGIYQALKVIEEIIEYMGYVPKKIVLEMARGEGKKERKVERKKYIENIYEKNKNQIENYNKLKKELANIEKINCEKLFLYFFQEGKSLYSQKPLDINRLFEYEVDHIIPQTLIKDNSIENKALVLKEENQIKAANTVLPAEFRKDYMKSWWQHLKKLNLITDKKYNNLCRYKFDNKSIEGFINRQLVETRQICKHVANIIEEFYPETKVVYIPASLSHNYREKFKLYKFREINDFHHAHDAYLTAVLGEYKTKYLKNNIDYENLKELNQKLLKEKKYQELKDGYVINSLDPELNKYFINDETGEVFDIKAFNNNVENTLYRNDILISKKIEFKTGKFFDETKQKKDKKGKEGFKLKANMPTKLYGSYTSIKPAYATVVKYITKNKEEQRMIGIPIVISELSKKNNKLKEEYIKNILSLKENDNISIIKDNIPFYTLLNWENGNICYLVGASEKVEVCNAKEFKINKENMKKWKNTFNRLFNNTTEIEDSEYKIQLQEIIDYIVAKISKEYKLYENLIPEMQKMFYKKELEIEEKEKVIIEMFKLLKCNSGVANLKCLNENYSSAFGKKNEKIISHGIIINQSITGLKETKNEF